MKTTLAVRDYELVLPMDKTSRATNVIRIFPKSGNHNIRHVFMRFRASDNDRKDPVKDLLEDTATNLAVARLHLGENERPKVLDFLRNERNRGFTFSFNADEFQTATFTDSDDDGVSRTVRVFKVSRFELHSKGSSKLHEPNPVLDPDPVVSQ